MLERIGPIQLEDTEFTIGGPRGFVGLQDVRRLCSLRRQCRNEQEQQLALCTHIGMVEPPSDIARGIGLEPLRSSGRDTPINEVENSRSARSDFGVVGGDDQRGLSFGAQGEEEFDNFFTGVRIEVAGGFVRKDQFG